MREKTVAVETLDGKELAVTLQRIPRTVERALNKIMVPAKINPHKPDDALIDSEAIEEYKDRFVEACIKSPAGLKVGTLPAADVERLFAAGKELNLAEEKARDAMEKKSEPPSSAA